MTMNATAHSWRTSPGWSALFRAARLLAFGFLGCLWLFPRVDSAGRAASLITVLTVAGLIGGVWYLARARAESRWRAALDRYTNRQLAQEIPSSSDPHARPQSKGR
jgi:hypothetical protein